MTPSTDSPRSAADALADLTKTLPGIVTDPRLASAAIADVLHCSRAERRALVVAVEIGLPSEFKDAASSGDGKSTIHMAIPRLIAEGFNEDLAHWAVAAWATSFGHSNIPSRTVRPDAKAIAPPPREERDRVKLGSPSSVRVPPKSAAISPLRESGAQQFLVGQRIRHSMYGVGTIRTVNPRPGRSGDEVIVQFERVSVVVQFSAPALALAVTPT